MSDVVSTLLSVVVGFALGAGWDWWRYHQREGKEVASVRSLVQLEMEQNRKALGELWNKVIELPPHIGLAHEEQEFLQRKRLVELPLLPWGRLMWESQAGLLAAAYGRETLEQAYAQNRRLDAFLVARAALHDVLEGAQFQGLAKDFDWWIQEKTNAAARKEGISLEIKAPGLRNKLFDFNQRTDRYWAECRNIHSEIMSQPNPL